MKSSVVKDWRAVGCGKCGAEINESCKRIRAPFTPTNRHACRVSAAPFADHDGDDEHLIPQGWREMQTRIRNSKRFYGKLSEGNTSSRKMLLHLQSISRTVHEIRSGSPCGGGWRIDSTIKEVA